VKLNSLTLSTGNKVLLMEDFFDADLLEKLHLLCERSETDDPDWSYEEWTKLRRIYKGNDEAYTTLLATLADAEFIKPIEQALGVKLVFADASLWADYPGFGPLLPHVEQHGQGQAQIFITRKEYPVNGTSIMNLDKQLLFTMPYRNNFGWFFDECTKVMHSREYDVPDDIVRYSLIFWYNYL
jgi:hypothetical protein